MDIHSYLYTIVNLIFRSLHILKENVSTKNLYFCTLLQLLNKLHTYYWLIRFSNPKDYVNCFFAKSDRIFITFLSYYFCACVYMQKKICLSYIILYYDV